LDSPTPRPYAPELLRGLWGLLRGLPARGAGLDRRPTALGPGSRRLRRALDLGLLAVGAVLAWIVTTGGGRIEWGPLRLSATGTGNPLALGSVLAVLRLALWDASAGRHALGALEWWGSRPLRMRAAALLALGVGLAQAAALERSMRRALDRLAQGAAPLCGVRADSHHGHLLPLTAGFATDPAADRWALIIDDRNPRGHLAAYYAYPRLVRIPPEEQRYAAHLRATEGRRADPGHRGAMVRPCPTTSAAWAEERGLELWIARPAGLEAWSRAAAPGSDR
jgi:hypothetical protein